MVSSTFQTPTPSTNGVSKHDRLPQHLSTSTWATDDGASNDFRSDIFTKPTLPMLEAIISTTLGENENEEDQTTNSFQEFVADLVGHEASLFVISGCQGNQVALRTALKAPPYQILADHRGHIFTLEGGGAAALCGAMTKMVTPSNGRHLNLDDIQKNCTLTDTIYDCPTRVISLENPLNGNTLPLSEISAISQWARSQTPPIHMHLDGARLWEAVTAGACTLRDMGRYFDSIQMCLSKGLSAPIGSIVTGTSVFIERAKWSRKLLGGSIRTAGVLTAPARVAIEDVFLGGKLKAPQEKAMIASQLWEQLGGKFQLPTETNMVWLDVEGSGLDPEKFYALGQQYDLKIGDLMGGRFVFHHQISDAAFLRLCDFFRAILGGVRP